MTRTWPPEQEKEILCDRIWFFYVNFGFVEIALQHQCLLLKWFLSLRVTFNCLLKLFFGAQFARTSNAMAFFCVMRSLWTATPIILMYACDGTTKNSNKNDIFVRSVNHWKHCWRMKRSRRHECEIHGTNEQYTYLFYGIMNILLRINSWSISLKICCLENHHCHFHSSLPLPLSLLFQFHQIDKSSAPCKHCVNVDFVLCCVVCGVIARVKWFSLTITSTLISFNWLTIERISMN